VNRAALSLAFLLVAGPALGDGLPPSLSDWGSAGLLVTPTARMRPEGTVAAGVSVVGGLYRHLFTGAQLLPGLEVTVRETVYPNDWGLSDPGLDAKLRLLREGAWWPALAMGGRDLTRGGLDLPGKGRFTGNYVVLSRRFRDVDASLGWGRLAGHDAAPFGGIEWHTPLSGLSLKLEYAAERSDDPRFTSRLPVNAGLAYRPLSWLDLGVGLEQGQRVMLRAAATLDPRRIETDRPLPPPRVGPRPAGQPALPHEIVGDARASGLPARAASVTADRATLWLDAPGDVPARDIGRAARVLADGAPAPIETLTVVTGAAGLDGVALSLQRGDLERALRHRGSPEELWRTARIEPAASAGPPPEWPARWALAVRPTLEQSLFEQGVPYASRTYVDLALSYAPVRNVVLGGGLRLNLQSNLAYLDAQALPAAEPVRSDVALYTQRLAGLEHLQASWLGNPAPGWHTRLSAGHFEEMFGGIGGEVLYRPMLARWAVGLDANRVWKRPAWDALRVDTATGRSTGHVSLYVEAPGAARTGVLRLGRYLGGDWGGTVELAHRFENGVRLGAYFTWTESPLPGQSRIGGRSEHGLALVVPLGSGGWLPEGGAAEVATRTLGRDAGQRLRTPLALYETAVPAGFGRLAGTWPHVLD